MELTVNEKDDKAHVPAITYSLTMTKEQAETLSKATEILARLGIGQFRDALECLPLSEFLPNGWQEDISRIGNMLSRHMICGVDGSGSSLGIHHKDVNAMSKIAWDLHQVLRHRLAWDKAVKNGVVESVDSPRKWPEMMQVFYDEPMKASVQPLAVVTSVEIDHADALTERKRNALRYRWLRGSEEIPHNSTRWPRWEVRHWDGRQWHTLFADQIDSAIDAAIANETPNAGIHRAAEGRPVE